MANRRYLNINIHGENANGWNLGLLRMHYSLPAETLLRLVSSRLSEFGLDLKRDIFAGIADAAQVMKNFGRISPADHQRYFSHALHLAVSVVVYENLSLNVVSLADVEGHSSNFLMNYPTLHTVTAAQVMTLRTTTDQKRLNKWQCQLAPPVTQMTPSDIEKLLIALSPL